MAKPASERPLPGTLIDPLYPDEDGRFKGETDFHTHARKDLHECLEVFFDPVPDVYVTSNLTYYYMKGDPRSWRDPDILASSM